MSERIQLTHQSDKDFAMIAQRSLVNGTTLPSGYRTPDSDMEIIGTELVPVAREAEKESALRKSNVEAWGIMKEDVLISTFTKIEAANYTISQATGGKLIRLIPDPNWNGG